MLNFDTQMILAVVGIALLGGLIGLDRTAVGQFMISQPIVAAPLAGWMFGDATTGFIVGLVLELIWLLDMPIGTFVPADSTVASIFSVTVAILGSPVDTRLSATGFAILLTVVLAPITMMADKVIRQFNSRLAQVVQTGSNADLGSNLTRAHLSGVWIFFMKFFVLNIIFIPLGIIAVRVFATMPDQYHRAMVLYIKLLPLLGVSLAVRRLTVKTVDLFLLAGFVVAAVMGQVFHAPALLTILFIVASGWLGVRYRERRI